MYILKKLALATTCMALTLTTVAYAANYENIVEGVSGPATNETVDVEVTAEPIYLQRVVNENPVGAVLKEEDIQTAKAALEKAKAEEAARKKAEEEARRKAEEEARRKAEEAAKGTYLGEFKLTFYTPDPGENGGYSVTATGKSLAANVWKAIAVDPRVIPLGSTVYIEGFGTFTAEDTGGAIKGSKIDILVNNASEADALGVQYAKVYVK